MCTSAVARASAALSRRLEYLRGCSLSSGSW